MERQSSLLRGLSLSGENFWSGILKCLGGEKYFALLLVVLTACNPFGSVSSIDPNFTPGKKTKSLTPSPLNSSISAEGPVVADGVLTATVSIVIKDLDGVALSGIVPTFAATGTGNTVGACSATDADGKSTCSLSSTKAEVKTLSLLTPIELSGGDVTFVAGAASASTSTLTGNATQIGSDGVSPVTFTLTLLDANSNPVSGKLVSLASSRGADTITPANATTDNLGQASFNVTSDSNGAPIFTAQDLTDSITILQTATVTFFPTKADPANCSITGSGPVVADGSSTSTITIVIRDDEAQPIAGAIPTFSASDTGSTNTYGSCSATDSGGQSTCTLSSTVAETKTLTLVSPVNKVGGTVEFTAGPATQLLFSTQPGGGVSNAVWAQQPVLRIQDAHGNLVTTGADSTKTVSLSLNVGSGTLGGTLTLAATGGIADFASNGLFLDLVGSNKVLRASASLNGSTVTANSSTFSISHGQASQLAFSTQPGGGSSAANWNTQPRVEIRDAAGNVVSTGVDSTRSVTLSLQAGDGSLSGTTTVNAVAGVATFSGLSINIVGADKVLRATSTITAGTVTVDSSAFTITHGAASQIVMTTQPSSSTVSTVAFATQPVIQIQDAAGNLVTTGADATRTITIALQTGTGTLGGTASMAAVGGVADFAGKGLNIDLIGTNKVLRATSSITAGAVTVDSSAFTITHGAASQIVMTTQPSSSTVSTVAFATQPVIQIQDAQGNVVSTGADATRTITIALQTGTGTLGGTASMAAVGGVADFVGKGLNINLIGTNKVLRASTTITAGAVTIDSSAFTITHGAASQIVMTTQPSSSTVSMVAFATQPVIQIQDAQGNVVSTGADATRTISLSLQTGTGTLGGTASMAAVGGVADFAGKGLNINLIGTNKVLRASTSITAGAVTVDSSAFTITHAAASQIVMTTQPSSSTVSMVAFATQPVIQIQDAQGNVVSTGADATRTITIALQTGTGTLGGTASMAAVGGVADFAGKGLNINLIGTNKVLRASTSITAGAVTVDSSAFTITHGAASQIAITTQPSSSTVAGVAFATQPVITIKDAQGNVVTTGADATRTITIALQTGTGTLGGTASMAAVAGVADFVGKGLNINLIGTNKVLRASTTITAGAVTADTGAFTITPAALSLSHSAVTVSSSTVKSGEYINLTLTAKDAFDNQLASGALATALTFSGGTSTGIISSITDNNNGTYTATLRGVVAGTASTLHATIGGGTVTSTMPTVTVNVGIATHLTYVTTPSSGIINSILNPQPKIKLLDFGENTVSSGADATSTITLTLQSGSGALQGSLALAATAGIADFTGSGIYFDDYGTKVIRATKDDLSGSGGSGALYVDSSSITVADEPRKIILSGDSTTNRYACSNAYTITSTDNSNRAVAVLSNTTITLGGKGQGNFYSDSSCQNPITQLILQKNTSSINAYFKGSAVESLIFTANASGFAQTTLPVSVLAGSYPTQVVLTGSASIQAGTCTAYTITTKNASNAASNVASDSYVYFSGAGNGQFFSDSGCTTSATSILISAGQSSGTVYYRNGIAESNTLKASSIDLTDGTLAVTSTQGSQLKLVLSGPSTLAGSTCSAAFTITSKDASNVTTNLSSNVTANLSTSGQGSFYSDASCTTAVTSLSMSSGTSTKTFYAMDDFVENVTLTVSDNANTLLSSTLDVAIAPATFAETRAGALFACGRMSSGRVLCWGYGDQGRLGNGSSTNSNSPVPVSGITTATAISLNYNHACAVLSDQTVKCWGNGGNGQLGYGSYTSSPTPVTVTGISTAVAVSTGLSHSCAVLSTGTVKCWGYNGRGQLGNGSTNQSATPVTVSNISTATAVALGADYACALLSSGAIKCWGYNGWGQLGDASRSDNSSPVSVSGISTATAISAGEVHTCARLSNSTIQCWGYNDYGQLGNGSNSFSATPVSVSNISTATGVATGRYHSCALLSSGAIKCWGYNSNGQLGNASTSQSNVPVSVSNITTATQISGGYDTSCARLSDSTAKCWGNNGYGQLGDGTTTNRTTPVSVLVNANSLNLFRTDTNNVASGSCLELNITSMTVGSSSTFPKNTVISLSENTGHHAFYSNSTCTSAATSVTAAKGDSLATIYFKGTSQNEMVTATASASGFTSASLAFNVYAAPNPSDPPSNVALAVNDMPIGTCNPVSIQLYNNLWQSANASGSDYDFTLTSTGSGVFYRDADCTQVISTASVPLGAPSVNFYFKDDTLEWQGLYIDDTTHSLSTNYWPNLMTATLNSNNSSFPATSCHAFLLYPLDPNNNQITANIDFTVSLSNFSNYESGAFYSDSYCTTPITQTVIPSGYSNYPVYFKDNSVETILLTATVGNYSNDYWITTYDVGGNRLALSGDASTNTGTCASYTVTSQNGSVGANTTVNLTGAGTGHFYSNSDCSTQITSKVISAGNSSASFYYKNLYPQSIVIKGTASGYSFATYPVTIQADTLPTQLSFSGQSSLDAGACSSAFSVTALNASNQASNVAENKTIQLAGGGQGQFFSDSSCSSAITSLTMSSGTNVKNFYFKDAVAETLTLNASSTGLNAGTSALTVSLGNQLQLVLSGAATLSSASCETYTITIKDSSNVSTPATSDITINLGGNGGGMFYSDNTCATSITQSIISTGNSSQTVYYANPYRQTLALTAQDNASSLVGSTLSVQASGPASIAKVAIGENASCAALGDGHVMCWGYGGNGQLGNGSTNSAYTPVMVSGIRTATKVAIGSNHACALLADKTIKCWGYNYYGGLGDGTTTQRNTPVTVSGISTAIDLSLGGYSSCALLEDKTVKCWGYNQWGQLGDGTNVNRTTPVSPVGLSHVSQIEVNYYQACARLDNGTVKCWGYNQNGSVGNGSTSNSVATPSSVVGLSNVTKIGLGYNDACAILTNGSVKCWGQNWYGQFGNGNTTSSLIPQNTGFSSLATSIGGGYYHLCALVGAGVKCSGYNYYGQLGDGTTNTSTNLVTVSGLSNATALSAGGDGYCVTTSDNKIKCWGRNYYGQLGDGGHDIETQSTITEVSFAADRLEIPALGYVSPGSCQSISITPKTVNTSTNFTQNLNISLASSSQSGIFYSDPSCTSSITGATAHIGDASVQVYFKESKANSVDILIASANGFTSARAKHSTNAGFSGIQQYFNYPTNPQSWSVDLPTQTCVPISVVAMDSSWQPTTVTSSVVINLSLSQGWNNNWGWWWWGGDSPNTYSDSSCSSTTSSVTIPQDSDSGIYYIRIPGGWSGTYVETYSEDGSYNYDTMHFYTHDYQMVNGNGYNNFVAGSCQPFHFFDNNWNNAQQNLTMDLSTPGNGKFFSDDHCTSQISTYDLSSNSISSSTFYFRDDTVESSEVDGSFAGTLFSSNWSYTTYDPGGYKFQFSGASSTTAGTCESYSINITDYSGNLSGAPRDLNIALSGAGYGTFYSDSGCTVLSATTTMSSGSSSSQTFYYKSTVPQSVILVAQNPEVVKATMPVTVQSSSLPTQLSISGSQNISTADCSAYSINSLDGSNNVTNVSTDTTIALTGQGNGRFYSDSGCSSSVTSAIIVSGTNVKNVYFKNLTAETTTLRASSGGYTAGTLAVSSSGSSLKLSLSGPSSIKGGTCSSAFTASVTDASNSPSNVGSNLTVDLSADSGTFYSDASCASAITQTIITSGTSSHSFYYKNSFTGQSEILAEDHAASLISAKLSVTSTFGALKIITGPYFSCALISDGNVRCWGVNWWGQLGTGTTNQEIFPTSVSGLGSAATDLAVANFFACALLTDHTVKCWGPNWWNNYGNGNGNSSYTPVPAGTGITTATAIGAAYGHVCALLADGTVKCWGINGYGQLGDGTTTNRSTPVTVSGISNATAISIGPDYSCALISDGTVKCWGYNGYGQLGDGTTTNSSVPVTVSGISNATQISSSRFADNNTCARLANSTIKCWGHNGNGQLGDGTTTSSSTPITVAGISNAISVSTSGWHTCALLSNASAKCWGYNGYGQLGDGTTNSSTSPVLMPNAGSVEWVSAENLQTCISLNDGTLKCAGYNWYYQLADGTQTSRSSFTTASNPAHGFAITETLSSLDIDTCVPLTIRETTGGTPGSFSKNRTLAISLSGPISSGLYSDPSCQNALGTTVEVSKGMDSTTIYFADPNYSSAGNINVSATNVAALNAYYSTTGYPDTLDFRGSLMPALNTCVPYTIVSTYNGQPKPLSLTVELYLTGSFNGGFYSDSNCSNWINTTAMVKGTSAKTVYFYSNSSYQSGYFYAYVNNNSGPWMNYNNLYIDVGGPFGYSPYIDDPSPISAATCTAINLHLGTTVSEDIIWDLGSNSGNIYYYSDSDCLNQTSSTTLPSGNEYTTVYINTPPGTDESPELDFYVRNRDSGLNTTPIVTISP